MWIGKHAHVEYIVRIQGNAAFESKRLEDQGQRIGRLRHQALDVALQLRCADRAGIDHLRSFAQIGQQLALKFNDLHQSARPLGRHAVRQWMAPACF